MSITDIDRAAPIVVRAERSIQAPLEAIWKLHTDVNGWPAWQHDVSEASLDGGFEIGASFSWKTAGFDTTIRSTIAQIQPQSLTLWSGPAAGILGIHLWSFQARGDAVLVVTEESFSGEAAAGAVDQIKGALEESLRRWLGFLDTAVASR